tara:strand:+ start:4987 stop:5598 length:612 start_codon:yes stop_codon:yes gene_type:complete
MAGVKSTDSALLDLYFQDISDSSPLPADAETEPARRIRVGDDSARNTLLRANLRFVVRVASEFQGCGMDLEDLISVGNVGVSNFIVEQMEEAGAVSSAPICVNQIKYHPRNQQPEILGWCRSNEVVVTAYSPLGKGDFPRVVEVIAAEIARTPAQVALRCLIEEGMAVIPKASSRVHLQENADVFGWGLPEGAAERIRNMDAS